MESLETTFFESPFYVYVALGFLELVIAAVWYERRRRTWAIALVVPPLLAGVVAIVAAAVVTDREQIVNALAEIAADVEAGRVDAAEHYLDEVYAGYGQSKAEVVAMTRSAIARYQLQSIELKRLTVTVAGGSADAEVTTHVKLQGSVIGGHTMPVHWRTRWRKRPSGWRIVKVEELDVGPR